MSDASPWPNNPGLVFALAEVLKLARQKGLLTDVEIDAALDSAEMATVTAFNDSSSGETYRQAALLPIKSLRVQTKHWPEGEEPSPQQIKDYLAGRTHEL